MAVYSNMTNSAMCFYFAQWFMVVGSLSNSCCLHEVNARKKYKVTKTSSKKMKTQESKYFNLYLLQIKRGSPGGVQMENLHNHDFWFN